MEVLSPNDRARDVAEKVENWLGAGVRLAWLIDPGTQSASIFRPKQDIEQLSVEDSLDGREVVSGFACHIRELFA